MAQTAYTRRTINHAAALAYMHKTPTLSTQDVQAIIYGTSQTRDIDIKKALGKADGPMRFQDNKRASYVLGGDIDAQVEHMNASARARESTTEHGVEQGHYGIKHSSTIPKMANYASTIHSRNKLIPPPSIHDIDLSELDTVKTSRFMI